MSEKAFVDAIIKTIRGFDDSFTVRPNDRMTNGIPDIIGCILIPVGPRRPWPIAIEAKELHPLMEDPFHRGRRTGKMLKHPFSGPQVSLLREMSKSGFDAFGLVRASRDTAFKFHPNDISTKTGNFSHEEMLKFGTEVRREDGVWNFWGINYGQILSSRHRNNPRD